MPIAETTIISFVKSMSGSAGLHWPGGTGASRRFQKSANSSRLLITSRNGLSDVKLLTEGRGYGLVPPKRSGRGSPVISGPGNNVIGSDFPRQTSGDFSCAPANNESRAQSNAAFIITVIRKYFILNLSHARYSSKCQNKRVNAFRRKDNALRLNAFTLVPASGEMLSARLRRHVSARHHASTAIALVILCLA